MSQEEIIKFLEKNKPNHYTAKELMEHLKIGMSIYVGLRRLRKTKEIKFVLITKKDKIMREYYV